ncbi:hypothetical protein [Pseudomonas koreensis]|nr:hypothetical protein [Pseudomonas koreensis]
MDCLLWWLPAAISERELEEGMEMISRFVVVPAVTTETGCMRNGTRFYCETAPIGFNIYDNEEKLRLKATYQTRVEAENECQRLNLERLKGVFSEQEHIVKEDLIKVGKQRLDGYS